MANKNLGGVFANMDFTPYVWAEYPKHVPIGPHGQFEVAYSKADEERILARLDNEFDNAPADSTHYVPDPEKEILISRARELQVPINTKWSKAKLRTVVDEAECAVDNLPAEIAPVRERPSNKLTQTQPLPPTEDDSSYESADDLKSSLYIKAKELGITGNAMHLWGITRLKQAIAEHVAKKE